MKTARNNKLMVPLLWSVTGLLLLAMLFARAVFPELPWVTVAVAVPLVGALALLIRQNRVALRSRSAAYGLNSAITIVLVLGIIGVANFMSARYPMKLDLTQNKVHTLSDQTVKLVKGLQQNVKAVLFAKLAQRDQFRPLLDNYKALSPKFEIEYVDPDREPTRAKQVGIRKYGTLQLVVGPRDTKIEEPTEEKLTNALIKLLKEKTPTLCAIVGHGERSFAATEAEGYSIAKQALVNQAYEVKDLELVKDPKVPDTCTAIAILGPKQAFFEPEVKAIRDYLDNGGRAIIASDLNLKGGMHSPELVKILESWHVRQSWGVIVDPVSRMLQVDAAVPIVATYSKDHAITKEFGGNCFFPFVSPLEAMGGAPAGLNIQWLGKTTPNSWAVNDPKQLATGEVRLTEKDKKGPLDVAFAVEGKQKDSKAQRNTRIVAFATSHFANNHFQKYGANLDFFLNAVSWAMEDESLISIRAKEEGAGKVELSQKTGTSVFLIAVVVIPLLIAVAGVVIWVRRRKL